MNQQARSFCFQLPDLPGTFEPVVTMLANAGVNINSIVSHRGNVVLSVDQPQVFRDLLEQKRIPFQELSSCSNGTPGTTGELAIELRLLGERLTAVIKQLEPHDVPISEMMEEQREELLRIAQDLHGFAVL